MIIEDKMKKQQVVAFGFEVEIDSDWQIKEMVVDNNIVQKVIDNGRRTPRSSNASLMTVMGPRVPIPQPPFEYSHHETEKRQSVVMQHIRDNDPVAIGEVMWIDSRDDDKTDQSIVKYAIR
jgi:hypothetical protein